MLILKLLAMLAFLFTPGYLAVSLLLGKESRMSGAERVFLAAVCGCGIAALMSMALGLASSFSWLPLCAAWLALSLALLVAARRRLAWLARVGWREWTLLALLALIGLALFLPPNRVVFGWNDDGSYTNIAALLEREGEIYTEVDTVREVAPERRQMLFPANEDPRWPFQAYLYKQYFITDFEAGEVMPQFFYPWPSLMAVVALFLGAEGMFYGITLASLLALWGVYLLARRMLGGRWAWVAAALAAISPLMVYFSKYTTSEQFTMALFMAACLALLETLREGRSAPAAGEAVLAALLLALGLTVRIDFSLVLPPLLLVFFWRRISGAWGRMDGVFLAVLIPSFAVAMLLGRFTSAPYFYSIFYYDLNESGSLLTLLLLAAAATYTLLLFFPQMLRGPAGRLARMRRLWVAAAWAALAAAFLFFYFVRPHLGGGEASYIGFNVVTAGAAYDAQNLVRWGWYLSFPGLLLLFAGYGLAVTSGRERSWSPLLAMGLFITFFYMWNMRCTPLQIMVMRRVMPVIFPLGTVMMVYALQRLCRWKPAAGRPARVRALRPLGSIAAALLLLYLAVFFVSTAWPIYGLGEGGNQRDVVRSVSDAVAEGTVLIDYNAGELFGPPLLDFEGRRNAVLTGDRVLEDEAFPALLADLGFPERPVYLLWRPSVSGTEAVPAAGLELEYVSSVVWREENLESGFKSRPDERVDIEEPFVIYKFVPGTIR